MSEKRRVHKKNPPEALPSPSEGSESEVESEFCIKIPRSGHVGSFEPLIVKFCWLCHFKDADRDCEACPRSFHAKCLTGSNKTSGKRKAGGRTLGRCQECSVSNVTAFPRFKKLSAEEVKRILMACWEKGTAWLNNEIKSNMGKFKLIRALDIVKDARKAAPLEYEEMVRSLPKVVSMKSIQERIRCGEIRTLEAFAAEMKWIYHNSVIYNGRSVEPTLRIKDFLSDVFEDLNKRVWDCVECQLHKATRVKHRRAGFFTTPCQIPHPVIWARLSGFPYWPAKITSANTNDGIVGVFFFGDHSHANLELDKCLTFSIVHPSGYVKNPKLKAAIREAKTFIDALGRNPSIGDQIVDDKAGTLPKLTREFIKERVFPRITPGLLRDMLHPNSTAFEVNE